MVIEVPPGAVPEGWMHPRDWAVLTASHEGRVQGDEGYLERRNARMFALYDFWPDYWTYQRLAAHEGITRQRVGQIFKEHYKGDVPRRGRRGRHLVKLPREAPLR
jgi:hypothetical protein